MWNSSLCVDLGFDQWAFVFSASELELLVDFFHSHSLSGLCLRLYKRFFEEDHFCKLLNDKLCLYDYNLYHTRVFRPGFIQLFIILIILIIFFSKLKIFLKN